MEIKKDIKESGAAGKPGESTAVTEKITLSASGMESLLKSEFAQAEDASDPTTEAANEIPAAEVNGEAQGQEAEQGEGQGEEGRGESGEAAAADAAPAQSATGEEAEAVEGEAPLPADAQAALDKWAETGGPLPPALQAVVGKRIGKLTAARETEKARADQAEAALAAAKAEAEALRNDPNRPAHATPPTVLDEKSVATMAATAQKMVTEIENYLDDSATDDERGRVERFMQSRGLDAKGLKRELRTTNAFLTQELPQLREQVQRFKQQEAQLTPVAKARFPWLDDKARPEYAQAQQVLGLMPEIVQRTPAHKVAVGTYVLGLKVLEALNAAGLDGDATAALGPVLAKAFPAKGSAAKTVPTKTPPPKTPTGGSAAPGKVSAKPLDAASTKFNQKMTRQSATDLARAALAAA